MPCSYCKKYGHNITKCSSYSQDLYNWHNWRNASSDASTSYIPWPLNPKLEINGGIGQISIRCQQEGITGLDLKYIRLNGLFWNVKNNINPTFLKQFKKRIELCERDIIINKNNSLLESSKLYLSLRRLYIYYIINKYNIPYDLYRLFI